MATSATKDSEIYIKELNNQMALAMDEVCSTCQQSCKQYTGFGYKFDFNSCKLWNGRNIMVNSTFNEVLVLEMLKQEAKNKQEV